MYRKLKLALPLLTLMSLVAVVPAHAKKKKADTATDTKPAPAAATRADTNANLKVDINNASEAELDKLPGVGKPTAKKIIAARPYRSAQDLAKAGVPAKTIQQITPMVVIGPVSSAAAPAPMSKKSAQMPSTPSPMSSPSAAAKPSPSAASNMTPAQQPPQKGMVWVNLETKVYHKEGQRWYGNTKKGKFMTEADAMKAGYRSSKE